MGEPLPPLLHIPGPASDVVARQEAETVVVEWTWPLLTTEGQTNNEIEHFTVYALPLAAGGPPPAPESFQDWGAEAVARIEGEALAENSPGARLHVEIDAADRLGQRIAYAVLSENRRGRVAPMSAAYAVDLIRPPAPPRGLTAEATADGVALRWTASEGATRYAVEKRIEPVLEFREVQQVEGTELLDRGQVWDRLHEYRVRPLADGPQGPVAGRPSEPVRLTPVDEFAPAAPSGVRAVAGPRSVELTWAAAGEADAAGYRVYRDGKRLTDEPIPVPAFSDAAVQAGRPYRYTVTVVDDKGNESEPSQAVEATLR